MFNEEENSNLDKKIRNIGILAGIGALGTGIGIGSLIDSHIHDNTIRDIINNHAESIKSLAKLHGIKTDK